MKSDFLFLRDLDNECVDAVYHIHEMTYRRRGIGLEKNVWINNVHKQYHATSEKRIQLFYSNDNTHVTGYNIYLQPLQINSLFWSKIIEGGVMTGDNSKNTNNFLLMYHDLLNWNNTINYLGETSISSNGVTKLLLKSGFKIASDKIEFESILSIFLNSTRFLCSNNDGKSVVKRETAISKNYEALVLLYMPNI